MDSGAAVMISLAGAGQRGLVMSSKSQIVILTAAVVLCGCAAHPDPIIDMRGVNESAMQLDWGECEGYSEQVIVAHVGSGAGYGAVWGATRSTVRSDREKQMVFKRCMRGRGYQVLN